MSPLANRRAFLTGSGALVVAFYLPGCAKLPLPDGTIRLGVPVADGGDHDLNAYIRVAETGEVTLRMGASEMGQGVYTSLPMILAEEMDADWSQVRVESAPTDPDYARPNIDFPGTMQITGGSLSVRGYWAGLRNAGAAAREMLVSAAAARWKVKPSECTTKQGQVRCGDRALSYGELAADASSVPAPRHPTLKSPANFTLVGTSPARLDVPPKVDGSAKFGMDHALEGLAYAMIRHCPHHGGTLVSFDDKAARAIPGIVDIFTVEGIEAVAVVAENYYAAKTAAAALVLTWDPGPAKGLDSVKVSATLTAALDHGTKTWSHGKLGATTIEATYEVPYLDHAPIEPVNATAWVQPQRVDIWAPTQAQEIVRENSAKIAGISQDKVFVHTTFLGGGFGRKGFWDFTDSAVKLSKHVGRPVKLIYTREECFAHGFYRPAVVCRLRAGLDANGMLEHYHAQIASQNILQNMLPPMLLGLDMVTHTVVGGLSHPPYDIPNGLLENARVELPIPIGWWRSVHGSHNGFFLESFIDECAHAAGKDPIAYRRTLLAKNPRWLAVYERAVTEAGPVAPGHSRGTAIFACFGSIVAEVADVTVEGGILRVHRVTAAVDAGMIVHPDIIAAQVESGVGMGLSMMMGEAIHLVDGAVVETNFHQYALMGIAHMPEVNTHIITSTELPGGIGEVALPPLPGAVCNAIFAATGKRIRTLPLANQLAT